MKHNSVAVLLVLAAPLAAGMAACVQSSDAPPVADAGGALPFDGSGSPIDSAVPPGAPQDAGQDAATAADANPPVEAGGDGGALGAVTCGAPTTLDTAGNPVVDVKATTLAPGKYAVAWTEFLNTAPMISKVRVFDGTTFLPEQTLSTSTATVATLAADGQGRGYAAWSDTNGLGRAVLDPATGVFGAPAGVVLPATGLKRPSGLAGFPGGGGIVSYPASGPGGFPSPTVSKYDSTGATWSAPQVLLDGKFDLGGIAVSATGKVGASWVDSSAAFNLYVSTSADGATWSTPVSKSIAPTGTGAEVGEQRPAAYANGDVLAVYSDSSGAGLTVKSVRFHAATGQFDAIVPIDGSTSTAPSVFIDASDRATVFYIKGGKLMVARDLGAGWGTPLELGATQYVVAAMDPNGNLAAIPTGTANLVRLSADGSTVTAPVPTGFTQASGSALGIAFDAAGHPVVFARMLVGARNTLQVSVCK